MGSKRTWEDSSLHINVLHATGITDNASPIGQQVLLNFGKGTCNRLLPASCYFGRRPPPLGCSGLPGTAGRGHWGRGGGLIVKVSSVAGHFSKMRPREWYSSPTMPKEKRDESELAPPKRKTAKIRLLGEDSSPHFGPGFGSKHGFSRATGVWVIWEWSEWSIQTSGIPRNQPLVQCGLYLNTGKWSGYGYHQPPSFNPIGPWCCLAVHGPWTWWGGRKVDKEEQWGWEGVCKI